MILRRWMWLAGLMATALALRAQNPWPDAGSVAAAMTLANNYWITNNFTNNSYGDSDWARGVYFTGNQRAARVLENRYYISEALAWGYANQWLIGPGGPNDADSYCCGQTYIDLFRLDPQPDELTDITNNVNAWVASPATNQLTWIDAFYMTGSTFARMGNLTGDTNYYNKLWQMYDYMKVGIGLFDTNASLWYRDATYIYPLATNANGGKMFWSRGNGWIFAGLARVLQEMPTNAPHYQDYVTMFQTMAPAIQATQSSDGMWRTSLYDPAQYPNPEESGTAFFAYGYAWGIRNGFLSLAAYSNTVTLAWHGLTNLSLNSQGFIGYVQATANAPGPDMANHTEDYGVGAFLLAASEIELLATNGPALGLWAGADQTLTTTNAAVPVTFTLDGSQSEVYRGPAGTFTWWEGTNQIASGITAPVSLSLGQHVITLQVPGVDGITYTDTVTLTVVTQSPPVLKLLFNFADSGTTTTDAVSGVVLRLVNSSGSPTDLHGSLGSGVGGYGKSLNFAASSEGGTGPMAFTTNNSTAVFGNVNAFTLALWINPASSLLVNGSPRLFTLGTNGITDRGVPNSLQLSSDGIAQPTNTSVQAYVNALGTSGTNFGAFNMPASQWSFLALTYDGTNLNFYGGSLTNSILLKSSAAFAAGPITLTNAWTLMLGNRLTFDRAFSGQLGTVSFYEGAWTLAGLEAIRASATAVPPILAGANGTNFTLTSGTKTNAHYILQSTPSLAPTTWTPIATNAGTGGNITNIIPINGASPQVFFRYEIQ